jgi:hypothetical protein
MKKFKPELPRRKNILSEAYAWERQTGKALPTLAEVQAAYDAKMQEQLGDEDEIDDADFSDSDYEEAPEPYDPNNEEDEDDGYMYEAAKPDFLDLDNDNNKTEPMKKAAADSTSNGNYVNKARAKSNLTKKDCSVYGHDASGKSTKLTSTSDVDNPKYKKFTIKTESLAEAFKKRMIGNFKGSEYILSETFKRK